MGEFHERATSPRRVSPRCNALVRIKVPRRGGRSLELAPNFFPITKEVHFMTGGSLFLLQRWRWSSCWGDPSISWLRKASCHVSVDPLVYYTVYIHFFPLYANGKLRLYDSGLLKLSLMLAMVVINVTFVTTVIERHCRLVSTVLKTSSLTCRIDWYTS